MPPRQTWAWGLRHEIEHIDGLVRGGYTVLWKPIEHRLKTYIRASTAHPRKELWYLPALEYAKEKLQEIQQW